MIPAISEIARDVIKEKIYTQGTIYKHKQNKEASNFQ